MCCIPGILKTILFVRILLAEQEVSLAVLMKPTKQILYLEFEVISFWGDLIIGYQGS